MDTGQFFSLIFLLKYFPHQRNMNEAELPIECSTESDGSWGNLRAVNNTKSSRKTRREKKLKKRESHDADSSSSEEQKEVGLKSSMISAFRVLERLIFEGVNCCKKSIISRQSRDIPAAAHTCLSYGADCLLKLLYLLRLPRTAEALVRSTRNWRSKAHSDPESHCTPCEADLTADDEESCYATRLKRGRILRRTPKQFLWLEKGPPGQDTILFGAEERKGTDSSEEPDDNSFVSNTPVETRIQIST